MNSTGISVDPETATIHASDEWWKDREFGSRVTKSLNRKPPEFWNVMVRCFALHDVQSQSQHSSRQRREELINNRAFDEEGHDGSDTDSGDIPQTEVPGMEEVYRVSVDDETRYTNEYTNEAVRNRVIRDQQQERNHLQGSARSGRNSQRTGGNARLPTAIGARRGRRRQSFESSLQNTISGFTELQRQSAHQFRPGAHDQEIYDEWKKAEEIFMALDLPKYTRFYWACMNQLKELKHWRKYFIDIAGSTDEDKIQLLEAMTGVTRNNEDASQKVGMSESLGSQHSGGPSSGSPSSLGNTLGRQSSWGLWGTPPTGQQWGTPPNAPQWGTPPNAPQWGTPPNAPQWGTPPNASQWGLSPNFQPWGSESNFPARYETPNYQQGGSSGTTPTNVQHGFSPRGHVGSLRNAPQQVSEAASPGLGFTNYFETGQISQTPRPGGLFNIWGTAQGTNASTNEGQARYSGDEE